MKSGITRRLLIQIVLFSSLVTFMITTLQLVQEYIGGVEEVRMQVEQMTVLSLPSLTENLWNLYERQIRNQLEDLIQLPDLQYLEVRSGGEVLAAVGDESSSNTLMSVHPLIYHRDDETIEIGELNVVATLERVRQQVYARVFTILVSNAMKTAIVSIFIFFIFQLLITKHLQRMTAHLQNFSLERFDDPLELDRQPRVDELSLMVTTINEMESDLRRAHHELVRKERLAALGEFVGSVAHELRNPLGTIATSLEMIQRRGGGEDAAIDRALGRSQRSVERCERIVGELLDFGRMKKSQAQGWELDRWLGGLLDEYPTPPGGALLRELECGDMVVEFDESLLRGAVTNLIDNAWQAMGSRDAESGLPAGATVTVRTARQGDGVRLEVIDNGPGVPPEVKPRIFEALFSTKSFGVGFGLAIVRRIAEQHGGAVDIVSELGEGARAVLYLPKRQPAGEPRAPSSAMDTTRRDQSTPAKSTVLG